MQLNYIYDQAVSSLPAGFVSALNYVATYLDSLITNNITVTIEVGYGEITQDGTTTPLPDDDEGGPDYGTFLSYATLKADLAANASSPADMTALANLPAADPSDGAGIFVSAAQEKALGLLPANAAAIDGSVGFQVDGADGVTYDYDPNDRAIAGETDFIGVAEHEITHALGRISGLSEISSQWTLMDLFRYSAPGVLGHTFGQAAYFSIDGGETNLDNFDLTYDPGSWGTGAGNDSFDAVGTTGVENPVTPTDLTLLSVLGFDISFPTLAITSPGGLTNQTAQTISGTIDAADAGLTVSIYDGTTLLGTVTPTVNGSWSTTVTLPMQGANALTAQATDAAGNLGTSSAVTYTLDTIAPSVAFVAASFTGASVVSLSGTSSDNVGVAGVEIFNGTTDLGAATLDTATGAWSFSATLAPSSYVALLAEATDAAGNAATATLGVGNIGSTLTADDAVGFSTRSTPALAIRWP